MKLYICYISIITLRIYSYWSCLHQPIVSSWPRVAPASRASSNTVIKASNQISSAGLACPNSWRLVEPFGQGFSRLEKLWFYMVLWDYTISNHEKWWMPPQISHFLKDSMDKWAGLREKLNNTVSFDPNI